MIDILNNYSILYAEDHIQTQRIVTGYLSRYFDKVYVAQDGVEALNLYSIHAPDVLMLDIDMPLMDGLSISEEVRKSNKDVVIVILTAYTDTDKFLRATELNLCSYLVKPITPDAFRGALEKIKIKLQENKSVFLKLDEFYSWNMEKKILLKRHKVVSLGNKERLLMTLFIEKLTLVVTHEDVMARLWEDDLGAEVTQDSVRQQVKRLRTKLPKNCIKNVYGSGYTLIVY